MPDSDREDVWTTLTINWCESVDTRRVLGAQCVGVFQGCFGPFFGGVNLRNGQDMQIHPHG